LLLTSAGESAKNNLSIPTPYKDWRVEPGAPARTGKNMDQSIDQLCVNTIRMLSVDAVEKAKSGHPGAPMGLAPAAFMLWTRFLKHNPRNPSWFDRDRFVLSAGHASMLLYSMLHLTGYEDMSLDQIKQFRQWGSRTPDILNVSLRPESRRRRDRSVKDSVMESAWPSLRRI
jgi:hypothetical protein